MTPRAIVKASRRGLTRQHFALYRGYLEGAALEGLNTVYGEPRTDVRVTRRLISTLRDTLAASARRVRDSEAAHLLRLRPGSIPSAELYGRKDTPCLESYRAQVDRTGFIPKQRCWIYTGGIFRRQPAAPNVNDWTASSRRTRARREGGTGSSDRRLAQR